jgi:hypothetical protein
MKRVTNRETGATEESSRTTGASSSPRQARSAVTAVRRRPGEPLSPPVRRRLESRFDTDLGDVRVHTDSETALAARRLGASAYAVGSDVVVAGDRPETSAGTRLLVHEVAHVVQTGGVTPVGSQVQVAGAGTRAEQAASRLGTGESGQATAVGTTPPAVYLQRDEELTALLRQIRALQPGVLSARDAGVRVLRMVLASGVDRTAADTVVAVTEAVRETLPESVPTVVRGFEILLRRETEREAREQARMEATVRRLQDMSAPRRGPYGTRGPDLVGPIFSNVSQAARPLAELLGDLETGIDNAGVFVSALLSALADAVDEETARRLTVRLGQSSVITLVFPPVFLSGAVVGIGQEIADIARAVADLYENFGEIVSATMSLIETMFSPEGRPLAQQFGTDVGRQYGQQIGRLSRANPVTFTYELGKLLGPLLAEIVVSLLVPGGAVVAGLRRTFAVVRRLVDAVPDLARLVRRTRRRRRRRDDRESSGESERETETRSEPTDSATTETPASTQDAPTTTSETPASTPETPTSSPDAPEPTVVRSRRDFDSDEAFADHLVETHPNVGRDPEGNLVNTQTGRRLRISEEGRVVNADTGAIARSADPVYDPTDYTRRPDAELPPHLRRGRRGRSPDASTPVTPAQLAEIERLAPDWLRQSQYWDRLSRTLETADARELVIPALQRFRNVDGFRTVMLNLLSGGTGYQGAQFVIRYALRRADDAGSVVFESGRRIDIFDPDADPASRWTARGREVDVTLRGPGVRVELKSWGPDTIRRYLIDDPANLHRQLLFDIAETQDPSNLRWVFDAERLRADAARTRQVLGIEGPVDLTPEVLRSAIVARLRESVPTDANPRTFGGALREAVTITPRIFEQIVEVE